MRVLMQFGGCFLFGLVISVLVLGAMMFAGAFGFIDLWLFTGKPLAGLALWLLPAGFWQGLTGVVDAAHNPAVRSFLELCAALGQGALVLAAGFFRLWYRHAGGVE
ncbi:hypothetical protein ID144_24245 [Pseudomonas sp. JM0905a]|uniref:Transmembrane protein n=1 Tax=Metapseudomonas resinovorans TaxID=53412 RepID=A0ABT4Y561_METRE|nr:MULTISPECIES: hypothetical protein [Pseudomonas]MBD2840160.1 hypothetical protein [Pseudomonas sp. JM0905a]MDA8483964.1 hypothetical protein [Pseudomonas resinovorans]